MTTISVVVVEGYWLLQWVKRTYICVGKAGFIVAMVACLLASFTLKQGAGSILEY